jgi:hypothetical protein
MRPIKSYLILLSFLLSCYAVHSQSLIEFKGYKDDESLYKTLLQQSTAKYEADAKLIKGENKKYTLELVKDRYESVKKIYDEKQIITETDPYNYLNIIKDKIIQSNPLLRSMQCRVLFSKVEEPNAYSTGEGTLVLNIGLFSKLRNESQVAFVLCHEFAHYYLDHSNKSIEHYINTVYSKEFQEQLKDIKKTQYQQREDFEKLAKDFTFKSKRHSREREVQADSMGLEFLKNTVFNLKESLTALALLDSVDKDKYPKPDLEKLFNFSAYPFRKSWTRKEEAFFGVTEREKTKYDDSLKTHPDCVLRVKFLEPSVKKYEKGQQPDFAVNEKLFEKFKTEFDYEIIDYCFQINEVSRCLYYTLEMLQVYPNDPYLNTMAGMCLNTMYTAQKGHILSRYVDLPSPGREKAYNGFLEFLQKVKLDDIAAFSYYMLQPKAASLVKNEDQLAAVINSKINFGKTEEAKEYIALYNKNYPSGKYKF